MNRAATVFVSMSLLIGYSSLYATHYTRGPLRRPSGVRDFVVRFVVLPPVLGAAIWLTALWFLALVTGRNVPVF